MLLKPLIINNWSGGTADSPYRGVLGSHATIVGLDIHSEPGIIQIAQKLEKKSVAVVVDTPLWIVPYSSDKIFALGSSHKVYYSADGGDTWTNITDASQSIGSGQGAVIFRNYLIIVGNTKLDIYGPISGTPAWTIGWQTIKSDTVWHPMLVGKRSGSLHIGAYNELAILSEVSGQTFAPADGATFTFTAIATTLPKDFRIKSLEEQGNYLMMGCWQGTNLYEFSTAVIYPWDYVLQPLNHNDPVDIKECGINAQLNITNVLYVFAGIMGNFYYYNGSNLVKLKKVPFSVSGGYWGYVQPGAVANFQGMLHFGQSEAVVGGTNIKAGVYNFGSLHKNYSAVLNLQYPVSAGISDVRIGSVCAVGNNILLVGWQYTGSGNYGIDKLNVSKRYATGGYFETLLYRIGTAFEKQLIEGFEIFLDSPLTTGQAIIVKFRRNTSAGWTTVKIGIKTKTFNYTDDGAKSEIYIPFAINNIVNLQFKVELETADGNTTPKLRDIMIQ